MYQVEWLQSVLDEILVRWLESPSEMRNAITKAVHEVDVAPSSDPLGHGESRDGNERVDFALPLVVHYEVDQVQRLATVIHARVVEPRNR